MFKLLNYAVLVLETDGIECPSGLRVEYRFCGLPDWAPVPGVTWDGNRGIAVFPYVPGLTGACIEVAVVCGNNVIARTVVNYP